MPDTIQWAAEDLRYAVSRSLVQIEAHVLAPKLSVLLNRIAQFSTPGAFCSAHEVGWLARDAVRVAEIMLELKEAAGV